MQAHLAGNFTVDTLRSGLRIPARGGSPFGFAPTRTEPEATAEEFHQAGGTPAGAHCTRTRSATSPGGGADRGGPQISLGSLKGGMLSFPCSSPDPTPSRFDLAREETR